MNSYDEEYLKLLYFVLHKGEDKHDRTGIGTKSITGTMLKHDMSKGFPALTTKRLPFSVAATELEGFLKGNTDKQWLKDRKCNIWNQWCNPLLIPAGLSDEERKAFQLKENDLGPIYGAQWNKGDIKGNSQIDYVQDCLKNNQVSRRMFVSAWNHIERDKMALEPCHTSWQVVVTNGRLDLVFNMRSVDIFLGLPFDMALYGLLLAILAKEHSLKPGILTGFFADTHLYKNHFDAANEQLTRKSGILASLLFSSSFTTLKDFDASQVRLLKYNPMPSIKAEVAV